MSINRVRETTQVRVQSCPFKSSLMTVVVCVLAGLTAWGIVLWVAICLLH